MYVTERSTGVNGTVNLVFRPTPAFGVLYGEKSVSAENECGDARQAVRIASDKLMFVLSDGMGTGEEARKTGLGTIGLIETFYRAGFGHRTIFNCVSRLLALRLKETFSALDVAVMDTQTGEIDFIKQGGRESYLFTEKGVEIIEGGSLPMGIIEDSEPIIKIQVWDEENVTYFIQEGSKGIRLDENEEINPRPHVLYTKDGDRNNQLYYENLGFIPFFRMDLNRKRVSQIAFLKPIIDDYDLMDCSLSNNLQDFAEGIYVVRNYQGEDIDTLVQNIRVKKAVGVDDEGGVDIKTIDIPYEARKVKLQLDEDNIYRFGMGFNSQKIGDGNITNVVIKSRYALLDLKCNKLEIQLKSFLRKIAGAVLDDVNKKQETAYNIDDVYFRFEREVITNALDNAQIELTEAQAKETRINALLSLTDRLDDETLMQQVCDALDIDYEEIKDRLPKRDDAALGDDRDLIDNEPETEGNPEAQP